MERERKYALERIGPGHWGMYSNDGKRYYRLIKYPERDGTLTRDNGTVIRGDFWLVGRWNLLSGDTGEIDVLVVGLPTRAAAIQEALSWDEQQQLATWDHVGPGDHSEKER